MNKAEQQQILDTVMLGFAQMKKTGPKVLAEYLKTIPDSYIRAMASYKLKAYAESARIEDSLEAQQKSELAAKLCQLVLNDLILKLRKAHNPGDANRDGAELFYRRAVNYLSRDRAPDAERLLKRCVEIEPSFIDGWQLLSEVLEQNGKIEAAENARARISLLRSKL